MDKMHDAGYAEQALKKQLRYSVRKFSAGVASVAVAAFMFFGGMLSQPIR